MPPKRTQPKRSKPKRKQRPRKSRGTIYKSSKGLSVPRAYNVEVRQANLDSGVETINMRDNAASATIPKNTTLVMPAGFNSDTGTIQYDGSWITPKWLTSKFRVSFDNIDPEHADSVKGFNLYMIQGVIKNTGAKAGVATDTFTNWCSDIKDEVGRQLVNSDFSSDYLDFTRANRNVKIVKKTLLKPQRNSSIRKYLDVSNGGYSAPPPMEFSVSHSIPNFKQRMTAVTGTDALNEMYIPFVAFMCDELTANTGTFRIEHNSRFYYTDM